MEQGYMDRIKAAQRDDVDPRLDNRTGTDRPPLESAPAVPQQIDGPDLMHQADHAEAVARHAKEAGDMERAGMFSAGDHSTGDYAERRGNDAGQADGRLETDPGNPSSSSTSLADGDVVAAAEPLQAEEVAKDARRAATGGDSETATAAPGERRSRAAKAPKE